MSIGQVWSSLALLVAWLPVWAAPRARGAWGVAYPPISATMPSPPIVFLHGMWAGPEESCGVFERGATRFGFLVCPRGNAPSGSGTMWSGTYADAEKRIRPALAAAEALAPGKMELTGGTLIGYSNGAYFAVAVACAEPGRWPGLVLLSMRLNPDPARLRRAGVRRVLLAAGDRDGARASMQALTVRLERAGIEARFMSLGPGGHPFPSDMADRMFDAIGWVRARGEGTPRARAIGRPAARRGR